MNNVRNLGLLTLRAGVGGVLLAHGVQKLFGWLGGAGLTGTADAFEQMGFRPGLPSAVAAGLGEAGGGTLIVLGLFTPAAILVVNSRHAGQRVRFGRSSWP